MPRLVLASSNPHKLLELKQLLKPLTHWDLLPSRNLQLYHDESPEQRALRVARSEGCFALADHSGLIVPALQPGDPSYLRVEGDTAGERCRNLLELMQGLHHERRAAYLSCTLALADSDHVIRVVTARCEGYILPEPKGSNGFGFDPVFAKYDYDRSFAQLDDMTRLRIGHRGKAWERLLPSLERAAQCTT